MTIDEAVETLRYEIDEECHCDYIANEIRFLIAEIEKKRLKLTEARLENNRQQAEIERLTAFKSYFDELYGKGFDIANWHENGDLEPFDNFYDDAVKEMAGDDK